MNLLLTILLFCAPAPALQVGQPPKPVETLHPNGQVHERFFIDAQGRKTGAYDAYRTDGTLEVHYKFEAGVLDGRAEEYFADGRTVKSGGEYQAGLRRGTWLFVSDDQLRRQRADYKAGRLNGLVLVEVGNKVISKQRWKDDELERLDDLIVFPVAKSALREKLSSILAAPSEKADSKDAVEAERSAALRRLQAYRALCSLPWEGMSLVPEWNLRCEAAAEVCAKIGGLNHTPPKPPDMDDARYRLGYEGASHSNLSVGTDMPGSVDGYMDDSDPTNIDRVGHRRWCLNPAMKRTGFGSSGTYSAMWSMDTSGKSVRGLDAVTYPPPGWCPTNMLADDAAFSISRLTGGEPKLEDLRVHVRPLDSDWVPMDEIKLDYLGVSAGGGIGSGSCIIFRPEHVKVALESRYLVEVSTDAGKSLSFRYVVAFCEAVTPAH
ncbi:MAG TPA: hypothetical protein VK843_18880 [Planctomycetota bacterium]|nr:hypothetical protein [Planctomycetota bacterium]